MDIVRRHMIFHGSVQGVGFRYRAYYAARSCGVSGWVRNLCDGTVEMEAQGEVRAIRQMIDMIENGSFVRIESIDSKDIPLENGSGFDIK
ncbi:MAG: acylphosphatase [Ruminococcus sp.]|nr:acylphosphatase [Ruminococcus sp.]